MSGEQVKQKPKYKKYDAAIKASISMTKRTDLFPEMNIPRTTALYWIRRGLELDDPILAPLVEAINETKVKYEEIQKRLDEKSALITLLHHAFKSMGFRLYWKHIESKEIKSNILNAVTTAMKLASREQCLQEIGLSLSRYKRWRREQRGCGISGTKSCPRGNANQLTFKEVQIMKDLVTSKNFAHFPIRSLHYYAKREGILYCSYSTWCKYIGHFNWQRARKKYRERKFDIGIRANRPNEIWHLDLSYFILPDKTKCYVQAVVDNYSRYVLAWQVLESYDGARTGELLQRAIARASGENDKILRLIVDGGSENS